VGSPRSTKNLQYPRNGAK